MLMLPKLEIMPLGCINMNRFIVYDEFGGAIRSFYTMREAKVFIRNKRGCKVQEISIFDTCEECLL